MMKGRYPTAPLNRIPSPNSAPSPQQKCTTHACGGGGGRGYIYKCNDERPQTIAVKGSENTFLTKWPYHCAPPPPAAYAYEDVHVWSAL